MASAELSPPPAAPAGRAPLAPREVLRTWWPLAGSWLLMGAELPAISAAVARLPDEDVQLAAWGGVVFPIALLVEAPIIMMLAASTALSRDADSYRKLLRFVTAAGAALTALHAAIAFTPLYDLVVVHGIRPPPEVVEPGRLGLQIMTPWTWAIADRRFHQGVLIRFGRARTVGLGTLTRLVASALVLVVGVTLEPVSGIVLAATAITAGVLVEMVVARLAVQPVLRGPLRDAGPPAHPLTPRALLAFYVPLALTPLLALAMQPIGSAALARLPRPLECLAIWPALNGFVFMLRSLGLAYNEVVVSHAEDPGARRVLLRFALALGAGTSGVLALVALTPLGEAWFGVVAGFRPELRDLAAAALVFGVLLPGLTVLQSHWQGLLTHARRTRAVTESVALFLVVTSAALGVGIALQRWDGLPVALTSFTLGAAAQAAWLRRRARSLPAPAAVAATR